MFYEQGLVIIASLISLFSLHSCLCLFAESEVIEESNQTTEVFVPNSNPEEGDEKKNHGKAINNSSTNNNNNNGKKGTRKSPRKNSERDEREELDRCKSVEQCFPTF